MASIEQALRRACELLATSEDSDWTPWTAAELRAELLAMLDALERGEPLDADRLRLLFIASGPIQETAMASGWSEEMHRIAAIVDRHLGD